MASVIELQNVVAATVGIGRKQRRSLHMHLIQGQSSPTRWVSTELPGRDNEAGAHVPNSGGSAISCYIKILHAQAFGIKRAASYASTSCLEYQTSLFTQLYKTPIMKASLIFSLLAAAPSAYAQVIGAPFGFAAGVTGGGDAEPDYPTTLEECVPPF
ncbi:hypothetical protein IMZ48_12970 [Candidatus Bathyarchaeota archaeon]|nr:hypothetical protein [Candidatus Bathyarchaeota archaeon]